MDFYGFDGTNASDGIAWTTDAKFPLGWTEYAGNPILTKGTSYDSTYAHKPFAYIKGGVKYHFYTAVGSLGRCVALAIGGPPSTAGVVTELTATNVTNGSFDLVALQSQWFTNDTKTISYINDTNHIIGQIGLTYDGTQTYFTFGHLYNSTYQTSALFTLAPLGSSLESSLKIENNSTGTFNILALQATWAAGEEKALSWTNAGNILGRVALGYDGTNCYFTWGDLFTGSLSTTEAMRLDPTGLNLKVGALKINGTVVVDGNRNASFAKVNTSSYTVATLPASPAVGDRAFVTDATTATFASSVAGGGSNKVPVYYDGTWKIG
jgi:hypothetical protein